jgi:spore maturation protein CgeB
MRSSFPCFSPCLLVSVVDWFCDNAADTYMRIFVLGPQFSDSFARNVAFTLERMGHEVGTHAGTRQRHYRAGWGNVLWRTAERLVPTVGESLRKQMEGEIRKFKPELLLVTGNLLSAEQVKEWRRVARCPVACWFIDAMLNVRGDAFFSGAYDMVFSKEPRLVETLSQILKVPAAYLPEACNPAWHRPVQPNEEQMEHYGCDVAGMGTLHPYRAHFFEAFAATPYRVRIWGSVVSGVKQSPSMAYFQRHYLGESDKALALNATKAFVDNMHFSEHDGVNNALFEAAGCGAFVLCDPKPTLQQSFRVDDEVVTFRSRDELLEKVRFYLREDGASERQRIRDNAWRRAHAEHTYEHRLSAMLKHLAL